MLNLLKRIWLWRSDAAAAILVERERCAKVCEDIYDIYDPEPYFACAEAIRKG